MPRLSPRGALREGWSARVPEYALRVAWSAVGDALFVLDARGGLHAFDGARGRVRWRVDEAHGVGGLTMAHHPSAALLATGGQDGRAVMWCTASGQASRAVHAPTAWVEHLAWSPHGSWLALASGPHVLVVEVDGTLVWRSPEHPSTVSAVTWASPTELATCCYGQVSFFELPSGTRAETLSWRGSLVSLALSPDGEVVACGSQDNTVHFWRRSTGHDSMMAGYPSKPSALCFDAAGRLLATSGGETITVWSFAGDGPEGTTPGRLELHPAPVSALGFAHRRPWLASGGREGGVVLWQVDPDGGGGPIGGAVVSSVVESLAWRRDDRALAAIDGDGGVTTFRVRS